MNATKIQVKGFNAGYKIEKYVPALSNVLRSSLSSSQQNEYVEAFIAGGDEMLKERNRAKVLSKMRDSAKSLGQSKDRGKDMEIDR